jgi:hypothetical protein
MQHYSSWVSLWKALTTEVLMTRGILQRYYASYYNHRIFAGFRACWGISFGEKMNTKYTFKIGLCFLIFKDL